MARAKLNQVQLEILNRFFNEWAEPIMEKYREAPGPLPISRFYLALHQVLYGPLTLREILAWARAEVTYGLLTTLRGQPAFKAVMSAHARSFSDYLAGKVLEAVPEDFVSRLVLTEILVTLPGFDPCSNPILEALETALSKCEAGPTPGNFKRLFDLLICYRDALRLAHDRIDPAYRRRWEQRVSERVNPLLDRIDAAVDGAKRTLTPKRRSRPVMPRNSIFIDLAAASVYSSLSPRTLRRWIAQGRLPAYRPGRKVLIRKSDLDALITCAKARTMDLDALAAEALRELRGRP